ncbi:TetR/AcrR family transcriptional regulator [Mycolicibacterium setense]|uniref:TetR family transcriptional regulator n=1 Tax=Mycolicibacterium setense TaxID=431269 RepID=A0ABR4YUI3_9MYCO|nr:TetR/AcrR family transcriptional regulator [Mycolicibacterium setense]KHO21338.1 TetR family transcriptional regulator [Mycolicibacterium setense]KHO25896.1 TetR family transcriptional regulator [Mycolicibacterium setense]MCV7114617.1 TetR/AcrR family transcriptional regulator [Mycolicibacterium setense]OBB15965.1 TetR family transcriptional regulator [Mycolicibacterium setense]
MAGRPRVNAQRRHGDTARDEILDAAGELFTTTGYSGTSTRAIAEAVGVRQASLYHYFKTKDDILCALLEQTVAPTLEFIPSLLGSEPALTADEHLHALAAFDGAQLMSGRWNLGALYLLPELREAKLEPFWSDRERLRLHYLSLSRALSRRTGIHEAAGDLPFRLVESLVNVWSMPAGPERAAMPFHVADACIRVLGIPDVATSALRTRSRREIERHNRASASAP